MVLDVERDTTRYRVEAADKALALLDVFGTPPHRFTLSELSVRSGFSPNQTFRLLQTLVARRFVAMEPDTKRYRLGLHLFRLYSALYGSDDLLLAAGPVLDWARDASGETVNLLIKDGPDGALSIDKRDSPQPLSNGTTRGAWHPLHAGASPKLLLALRDDAAIDAYLAAHHPLPAFTPWTLTDVGALRDELRRIRAQGYATSNQEARPGACAIAAPIYDREGGVLGSVSITAPVSRFAPADQERLLTVAIEAARRLSGNLGYRPVA